MELREILLIGHILGVVAMAFGTGAEVLPSLGARGTADLRTILNATRLETMGGRVTSFSSLIVLAFGIWLVIETPYEFSEAWISAAFGLFIIAAGLGGGVLARHARRVTEQAQAALERGETSSEAVRADYNATLPRLTGGVLLLMYVVFIYLMVAKPGS